MVRVKLNRRSGRVRLLFRKQVNVPPVLTLVRFLITLGVRPSFGKTVLGTVVFYRKERFRGDRNHLEVLPAPELDRLHEQGFVRYRRIDGERLVQSDLLIRPLNESLAAPEAPHGAVVIIPQDASFENRFRMALRHAGMVEVSVNGFF